MARHIHVHIHRSARDARTRDDNEDYKGLYLESRQGSGVWKAYKNGREVGKATSLQELKRKIDNGDVQGARDAEYSTAQIKALLATLEGQVGTARHSGDPAVMRETAMRIRQLRGILEVRAQRESGVRDAKKLATFTEAEDTFWLNALNAAVESGKSLTEADEIAWRKTVSRFPRLRSFEGARP